jgi:hypothetical protein
MIRAFTIVLVLATLFALPTISSADAVTWNLVGVTFDGGGTATGSFVFNADANAGMGALISADIVTAAVTPSSPYAISSPGFPPDVSNGMTEIVFVQNGISDLTGAPVLDLVFAGLLTDAGGTVGLAPGVLGGGSQLVCADSTCSAPNSEIPQLNIAGGKVVSEAVTTPEPSAFLLLGMGLLTLAGATKRRMIRV